MAREPETPFREIGGTFYRIVTEDRSHLALAGAHRPEGRFHHDGQPALYVSSRPDWAEQAIDIHVRPDDPPRLIHELEIGTARVLDLRAAGQCARWGAEPG